MPPYGIYQTLDNVLKKKTEVKNYQTTKESWGKIELYIITAF
jgi:hypothetical protein